jgi:hypothetical protein
MECCYECRLLHLQYSTSLRPISNDAHDKKLRDLVKSMIDIAKTKKAEAMVAADAATAVPETKTEKK